MGFLKCTDGSVLAYLKSIDGFVLALFRLPSIFSHQNSTVDEFWCTMAIMQEKQKKTPYLNYNVYHLLSTVYYILYTVKKLTWSYQTCLENLCVRQPNKNQLNIVPSRFLWLDREIMRNLEIGNYYHLLQHPAEKDES